MKNRTAFLTRTALMTAVVAILSPLSVPLGPIPFTMQTFVITLAGALLGVKGGLVSVVCYLLLGACGLPVFSGFQGGVTPFIGPTGGFLWSFPLLAVCAGLLRKKGLPLAFLGALLGLAAIYLAGTIQFSLYSGRTFWEALRVAVIPFVLKDALCAFLAVLFARLLSRRLAFFDL